MGGGEIIRLVADNGPWALVPMMAVIMGRSRPGRELGETVARQVRWWFLGSKGYTEEQRRQMVFGDWTDPPDGADSG